MDIKAKWIEFLYKLATGTKRTRTLLTPVGAIVFGVFTAIFIAAALALDKWLGFPAMIPMPLSIYFSAPVLLIGVLVTGWSIVHFFKVKGTPVPANPPPELVETGPYAFSRNPMLTGIFIILFGLGELLGSISLTFIFTPLFILVNRWELKEIEEPELVRRLGKEYIRYRDKTPMFIPDIRILRAGGK
jgi:protein-S-isoprenylcysteine O-methyltransferase Ste14